jgi:hypothetical protein
MVGPLEVPELNIRKHPSSTLKNIDGSPPRRCRWRSESAHHQRKIHRWWAPWEVLELEIRECPPSTLRNVDGGPPWEVPELEIREHPLST